MCLNRSSGFSQSHLTRKDAERNLLSSRLKQPIASQVSTRRKTTTFYRWFAFEPCSALLLIKHTPTDAATRGGSPILSERFPRAVVGPDKNFQRNFHEAKSWMLSDDVSMPVRRWIQNRFQDAKLYKDGKGPGLSGLFLDCFYIRVTISQSQPQSYSNTRYNVGHRLQVRRLARP